MDGEIFHHEDTSQGGQGLDCGGGFPKMLLNAPVNISLPLARLGASLVARVLPRDQQGGGVCSLKVLLQAPPWLMGVHVVCRCFGLFSGVSLTQG